MNTNDINQIIAQLKKYSEMGWVSLESVRKVLQEYKEK